MAYSLMFQKTDTLSVAMTSGSTSFTLNSGNFGSPSGTQLYVIDYDVPALAEVVSATVAGTAGTSVTRGIDGTSAVAHAIGAKVGAFFVPSHYNDLQPNLGFAKATTAQNGISTVVDLTGLSQTVTISSSGRSIKITGFVQGAAFSSSTGRFRLSIKEGSTTLSFVDVTRDDTVALSAMCVAIVTPTAGSHTYKLTGELSGGTGTVNVTSSTTGPSFILVENL